MSISPVPEVASSIIETATAQALSVLNDPATPARVAEFYDPETNFAGATFVHLQPNDSSMITAADLLAVTTLGISFPPRSVRRVLEDQAMVSRLSAALQALPEGGLRGATDRDFASMAIFYDLVKQAVSRSGSESANPWVTASKLAARKRPDLFPVRDRVVCSHLGIAALGDRAADWKVFQALLNNDDVQNELAALPEEVQKRVDHNRLCMDTEPLRLLDAALWTFARRGANSPEPPVLS